MEWQGYCFHHNIHLYLFIFIYKTNKKIQKNKLNLT